MTLGFGKVLVIGDPFARTLQQGKSYVKSKQRREWEISKWKQ